MKVALVIRKDFETRFGGDVLQVMQTASALRALGVEVEVQGGLDPAADVDVVHIFNLTRASSSFEAMRICKRRNIPYVISPIWHSLEHMRDFFGARSKLGRAFPIRAYTAAKELYYEHTPRALTSRLVWQWTAQQRNMVNGAAALIVNSPEEAETLFRELRIRRKESVVAPLAVPSTRPPAVHAKTRTIVCAGRIEPRKNTLSVVSAFLEEPRLHQHKLILAGAPSDRHRHYVDRVLSHVDGARVEWVGQIPHEEVLRLYASSRVAVLASFFETCGLVGLEALSVGTNVVMTTRSYTDYYYGPRVEYCDPYEVESIGNAMARAAQREQPRPETTFFERHSWATAAEVCRSTYARVIDG